MIKPFSLLFRPLRKARKAKVDLKGKLIELWKSLKSHLDCGTFFVEIKKDEKRSAM